MLRLPKKGAPRFDQNQDEETYLENLAVQRNASAFFEKYDRSEVQELLTTALVSWLSAKEDVRSQLDMPCGIMSQMNNVGFSTAILLTPVDPTALLDYREVHQIIRELAVGIYCLNQIPSISLEANYDQSSSCQLPPAYFDTRIGQILINIDYMLKALWHGIYMPKEKRARFSELWRTIMDIDPDGKPQTNRDIFAEFSSAGLIDITKDPDFDGIYDEDMNDDPTYNPNSPEEKAVFMKYAEYILLKMTFSTTQVQQCENVFIFETAYWLTNAIKCNQDNLDICTYQRLQQRLYLQKKIIQKHFEKKKEIRKGIGYLKLICFLTPFLLSLKKKMKVPYLSGLLPPFSDDKVKTERELPPFIYGRDFKCQNFHYKEDQYFHVHGGIEFDISTPSIENALEDFKNNLEKIRDCAVNALAEDSGYKEHYSIPVMKFNGKSYYVISFELEIFYQQLYKTQWWGAINEIVNNLRLKRLPLTDAQLHEQFKKKFGFKKAMKCKSIPFGMKSAVERGLYAVFHTFSRKTSSSTINISDEAGYAIFHHAALHNRVPIICQLCNANFNVNQRRFIILNQDILTAVSSVTIAEVARDNKEVQDAMALEGAIPPLVALFKGKQLSVQVKGAMAVEALASHNPAIQRAFLEKSLSKYLLKLLKAFQIDVKEQGAVALWALAGQTLKQQKYMAEQIGYNFIINMLLSPSAKMQYVGVAHTSNPVSQQFVVDENAFPVLIQLLRNHPSPNIKVEVAFSLACIVLRNDLLQKELQEIEGFDYADVLYLLHSEDKIIVLAKVIIDVDHITLTARGVTILVDSLNSADSSTIVLTGNLIATLAHSRAGIPEAFTTLGTVQQLCYHLYSGQEEVRMACSSALGYLTYNANAFRLLLKECRNKPNQFLRITSYISRDASINPAFLKEFEMQQKVGLPSLSLEKNGGPSIIPVFKKGKEHRRKLKPKVQPRDSLTFIPPVTNFMGLFKTTKKTTVSHNIFSFSSAISSDIITVSRPRIVLLNQLGKHVQKANPEPGEG
ncbi:hypothetical protein MJG53_003080 [Ovis ammon polii x Ovis aries]|uniref:Uncharacterized protein n=1 Tax=Ovis ammon polii x Ovis aries TaxID=2918886 RepID=A0ACB9VFY9_9CETA|nr:hypothetical protein MJT46_004429 [Ovis ammon polii x Ovis aries]KAI4588672.1 hypothetical protein MJG53_003080 [Ovis ammon polii x Ovis aries]